MNNKPNWSVNHEEWTVIGLHTWWEVSNKNTTFICDKEKNANWLAGILNKHGSEVVNPSK